MIALTHYINRTSLLLPRLVAFTLITILFTLPCETYAQQSAEEETAKNIAQKNTDNISLDELLLKVKQGHRKDQNINQKRLTAFKNDRQAQQALFDEVVKKRIEAEKLSHEYEQTFEDNEQKITQLQDRLFLRLGSLKELFGVLQLVSNDTQGQFDNSLIQMHYPARTKKLNDFSLKMGQTAELPTIEEIEALWFELQREMTESGKTVQSKQIVLNKTGKEVETDVTRIGTFNLVANGKYLQRIPETGRIIEFSRQPNNRYMTGAKQIENTDGTIIPFTIDPIRGQLIALKGTEPNLTERVHQGGVIGYIILSFGFIVVLIAIIRYITLFFESRRIAKQLTQLESPSNNALGRVLTVYHQNTHEDIDALELKLGEAILREVPRVNRGLSFIKLTAAIAPLLGLLGTVTGMIITFQAITLFGAGDPKLMAGGISQALVTTVLGLVVAIPTLFLHNIVQGQATNITETLEQEAVALVALQIESEQVEDNKNTKARIDDINSDRVDINSGSDRAKE